MTFIILEEKNETLAAFDCSPPPLLSNCQQLKIQYNVCQRRSIFVRLTHKSISIGGWHSPYTNYLVPFIFCYAHGIETMSLKPRKQQLKSSHKCENMLQKYSCQIYGVNFKEQYDPPMYSYVTKIGFEQVLLLGYD